MGTLTEPTGTEILSIFPVQAGESAAIGTMSAATIDLYVSNLPDVNVVTIAFVWIQDTLGTDTFDDADFPSAWNAMIYACIVELLKLDRMNRQAMGNAAFGSIELEAYNDKINFFSQAVGVELRHFGITTSKYFVFPQGSAVLVENSPRF